MTRRAKLDDWQKVKELWGRFMRGRAALRIPGDLNMVEHYFAASLTNQELAFVVMEVRGEIKAFCIIHTAFSMDLSEHPVQGLQPNRVAFIRALHAEPVDSSYSEDMKDFLNNWAASKGCHQIQGYCRLDFPLKAYERLHGIRPLYYLVGKEVV